MSDDTARNIAQDVMEALVQVWAMDGTSLSEGQENDLATALRVNMELYAEMHRDKLRAGVEALPYYSEMLGPEYGQMTHHRMAIHANVLSLIDKAKP